MSIALRIEPRTHPRIPAVLRVSYDDPTDLLDYTENMSESGLFIATERSFESGDEFAFELSFPGLVKPIRLTAQVIWRRVRQSLSDPEPPGVGVRLVFASDLERVWLRRLVGRFAQSSDQPPPEPSRRMPTILVVEGNPNTRGLFSEALRTRLFEGENRPRVVELEDAESAMEVMNGERVDLVVIESSLCPQVGQHLGEALLASRNGGPRVPVVLIAKADEQLSGPLKATVDVCLRRPVPAKALLYTAKMLVSNPEE